MYCATSATWPGAPALHEYTARRANAGGRPSTLRLQTQFLRPVGRLLRLFLCQSVKLPLSKIVLVNATLSPF